ncbi:VOC family protein [Crocosphaera sp. UHCC 0190]|uniref:SMU1112c/YaeR family gloxylase I-like metalloprotein n=1 Tax=Crocosphaera sp. UHCC 0190 TaxID=3110246 RepID=UPI002B1EB3D8|nr:VOC family protein [Crocosphaera sp. UHCC 0190]MEA5512062.1 VOC family protein [Crocosphaera sp. UHCC 0190]
MNVQGFHHVAIICSNYEQSKQFYLEILGCSLIRETFRTERNSYKLDLRLGENDYIELFYFLNPPARMSYPEACGLRHLALRVNELDKMVDELTSKGIVVEPIRRDELTEKRFTFFQDPDGLPIELYED